MNIVVLNGHTVESMADVHRLFDESLHFPAWYGANLDALYDMLGEQSEAVLIFLSAREKLLEKLGRRGTALMSLLERAAQENPRVILMR